MVRKKSLQAIQDFYQRKGLQDSSLRRALERDKEYARILNQRRNRLKANFKIKKAEQKKYVLSLDEDYHILGKIKILLQQKLTKEDKEIVTLLRTQLEHDWRKPLLTYLNKTIKKYSHIKKLNK